jgi:hypothetical protein
MLSVKNVYVEQVCLNSFHAKGSNTVLENENAKIAGENKVVCIVLMLKVLFILNLYRGKNKF